MFQLSCQMLKIFSKSPAGPGKWEENKVEAKQSFCCMKIWGKLTVHPAWRFLEQFWFQWETFLWKGEVKTKWIFGGLWPVFTLDAQLRLNWYVLKLCAYFVPGPFLKLHFWFTGAHWHRIPLSHSLLLYIPPFPFLYPFCAMGEGVLTYSS